ncbi:TRNA-specific 2-thiouridylase [Actinidia chinensis var. chinensis]|uniref:tRNA-specific 2-thiouridylase n=1 Tax=Actinidia chinensis var. chinensis TaxID=1590841 RepID=A0A2R6QFP3_ACTCC|nr:TRNA-specific 2-thiouridylase [Actinidia chinensis var. chinensis]
MEEDLMSAKEAVALSNSEIAKHEGAAKRQRFDQCFSSFMEISIEPGIKSLKHLDSKKFKSEIKRWAKAVVIYACQVSERFGSPRWSQDSDERFGSSGRINANNRKKEKGILARLNAAIRQGLIEDFGNVLGVGGSSKAFGGSSKATEQSEATEQSSLDSSTQTKQLKE